MAKKPILLSWSSGKDSAWSLQVLRQDPAIEVVGLLTTVNTEYGRVAMHGVRNTLLEKQAQAAGIDLWLVPLPNQCTDAEYAEIMTGQIAKARDSGIEAVAFGDLFLEDLRAFREQQMAGSGIGLLFPLWLPSSSQEMSTKGGGKYQSRSLALAEEMQAAGLRAMVTCVDPRVLDSSFAGRPWDAAFLRDLPAGVDPCGGNGEFHTFTYEGPMLNQAVPVATGEVVERDGFVFADLIPV